MSPSLPRSARLPINRCNLPVAILGSLTYLRHPVPLELDGVAELHRSAADGRPDFCASLHLLH